MSFVITFQISFFVNTVIFRDPNNPGGNKMTKSTTNTGKKTLPRKKRPARKREEFMTYIIEISDARTSYSFSVNKNKKLEPGPYREFAFLECTGTLIYPEKFAGTIIECTVSGDRRHVDYVEQPLKYD